jgi:hypothetical protein
LALIAGAFAVAYSDFNPRSATVPAYSGVTFAGELSYVPRDTTRLKFGAQRGLEYSYDSTDPYYLQTAFNVEFAQQIFGPVDFVAREPAWTTEARRTSFYRCRIIWTK